MIIMKNIHYKNTTPNTTYTLPSNNNFSIKLNHNEYLSEHDLSVMIARSVIWILWQFPPTDTHIQNIILDLFGVLWCKKNINNTYTITLQDTERILKNSKKTLKIGEQYFRYQPMWTRWYVSFKTTSEKHVQQIIYIREKLSKVEFENTLFHEIHHFIYNIIKFLEYKGNIDLWDRYQLLHNEFFTRVNTANHSMLRHERGEQNRDDTWWNTWYRDGHDRYAQSTRLAEHYIVSRNMMYNVFLKHHGTDNTRAVNRNIKDPWYTLWSKIVSACNNYLFYMNNKQWLIDFLHTVRTASRQSSPRNILQYFKTNKYTSTYPELVEIFFQELPKI